jgi:hypothetical protein
MVMERWGARQEWGQQAKAKVKAKAKEQEGRAETRIFSEEGKVRVEVGGGQCMSAREENGEQHWEQGAGATQYYSQSTCTPVQNNNASKPKPDLAPPPLPF